MHGIARLLRNIGAMTTSGRLIAVIGSLGIRPLLRLPFPARRLLAFLAVRGGSVERGVASAELWPDHPEESGRANLRRALWQVPRDWINAIGDMLVLDADCDLQEARHSAARALEGQRLTFDEIDRLCSDLLLGWHEEWALAAHDEFRLLRIQALEAACRTLAVQANYPLAVRAGAAAVAAEPLRESATEALIEAHLAQHNRFEAVQCYLALQIRLKEELGVEPDPKLVARMVSLTGDCCAA
jgi:DNA-binding SARP family transcriptional activator